MGTTSRIAHAPRELTLELARQERAVINRKDRRGLSLFTPLHAAL